MVGKWPTVLIRPSLLSIQVFYQAYIKLSSLGAWKSARWSVPRATAICLSFRLLWPFASVDEIPADLKDRQRKDAQNESEIDAMHECLVIADLSYLTA